MVGLTPLNSRPSRRFSGRRAHQLPQPTPSMLDSAVLQQPSAPVRDADLANAIRALAMDGVEAAKSGHPGMPMGMAEIAVALWTGIFATIPRIRTGQIATGSCCR